MSGATGRTLSFTIRGSFDKGTSSTGVSVDIVVGVDVVVVDAGAAEGTTNCSRIGRKEG